MFGSPGYLFDEVLVGSMVGFVCVVVGYLVWRRRWQHRERRRDYRERGRQRRQFWGWE